MKKLIVAILALGLSTSLQAQVSKKRIEKDIKFLSSDELKGRFPGTEEEKMAANYLAKEFKKLKLEPKGNDGYFQEFPFKSSKNPHASENDMEVRGTARNVVAYLDNGARYTIVIGAHYDHLGMGLAGHSLDPNPENKIHNGADDNASGTAGVLELARYYAKNKVKEKHNFLFICFSAEEEGLLGSKFYCNQPTIELNNVSFMLNMDMIGRLNDSTKKIIISGVGTSPSIPTALASLPTTPLSYKADSSGMGPSDHASFYLKNIPAVHFYTGAHQDYHKPGDDADKINYRGEEMVLNYIVQFIEALSKEEKIIFTPTKQSSTSSSSSSFKVTLGIIPDYAFDGKGLRLDGATEGKPAFKAGLQQGDVIIKMNNLEINNIQDYMKALSLFQKGQSVEILYLRNKAEQKTTATF